MARALSPMVHAMLLCDYGIMEHGTGKHSLCGVFEIIFAQQFPCIHKCFLFLSLSNGHGLSECELRSTELGGEKAENQIPFQVNFREPQGAIKILYPTLLTFTHEGTYQLEFICEREILKTVKLVVKPAPLVFTQEKI